MKKILTGILMLPATVEAFSQNKPIADKPVITEPISEILLPVLFILSLVFMLISLIRYFLEFRLKNKLIDRGMSEQLSAYLVKKNDKEKQHELIKLSILFCGIGLGLTMVYLTSPIHIHSLAIMAFSIGLSYLVYFFYLRRQNT